MYFVQEAFRVLVVLLTGVMLALPLRVVADVALSELMVWEGHGAYLMNGAPMAIDGPDSGTDVDTIVPARFTIGSGDISTHASVEKAFLYWGGTQAQPEGPLSGTADPSVSLTLPNGSTVAIVADASHGSDGDASSYDMFVCRADVTALLGEPLTGQYTVSGYSGAIANRATDNASAVLLLIFSHPDSLRQRIVVHDGLVTVQNSRHTLSVSGFAAVSPPAGTLAYYTMEGDVAGGPTPEFVESVVVTNRGGGQMLMLSDAINPAHNPMNHTINVTSPAQTSTVGMDLDKYDISAVLRPGDTALDVVYSAGMDKWWLAVNVTAVNIPAPLVVTIRKSEPNGVELCWPSVSNLMYQVQYQSQLVTNAWADLGAMISGNGATNCIRDSILSTQAERFYRVVVSP